MGPHCGGERMRAFLAVLLAISTFFLLLLTPYPFLARPEFIRLEYSRPHFPPSSRFTPEEREHFSIATLRYLNANESLEYLKALADENGPIYNERELAHMADVKRVATGALFVLRFSLLLALSLTVIFLLKGWRRELSLGLAGGAAMLVALGLAIGVTALVNFDFFFTLFHRLFFEGDSWLFPYTDSLIQLYPLPFWVDATKWWLVISGALTILTGLIALILYRFPYGAGQGGKLRGKS